jgi:hypothetical protein
LSPATLKIIEQQSFRAKSPLAGDIREQSAPSLAASRAAQGDEMCATQRQEVDKAGVAGGHVAMESKVKDALSMRINMETEILGLGTDAEEFNDENDSSYGSDAYSPSPSHAGGCMTWVKTPLRASKHASSRRARNQSESLLFRPGGSSWVQGLFSLTTSTR